VSEREISPYLIAVEYDQEPQWLDDKRWVISAAVDIGDRLLLKEATSLKNRFIPKIPSDASLNGDFLYVVCSPDFRHDPSEDYRPFIERAFVQEKFDEPAATAHLRESIETMGIVSLSQFTENIHAFLETEEWDYVMGDNK
jgi:hypothetical protein